MLRSLLLFLLTTLPLVGFSEPRLDSVLLLDADGAKGPGRVLEAGITPFGALVAWEPSGRVGLCSVTHISPGVVLTAAHCIKTELGAQQHFVLFYGKDALRHQIALTSFRFIGTGTMDVAIATISGEDAKLWDAAGSELKSFDERELANAFKDQSVTLWSYTPLTNYPDLMRRYPDSAGMVFSPNRCRASRVMPKIEVMTEDPTTQKATKVGEVHLVGSGKIDEKTNIFLDDCSGRIVTGNSGSLITSASAFSKKVGVLHLFVTDKDKLWKDLESLSRSRGKLNYYYRGNDDRPKPISWGYGDFWIGAGIILETLIKNNPRLLD